MNKGGKIGFGIIGLFLLLFFLNTVSHDYFCHEELHTVCGPLHSIFMPSPAAAAEGVSVLSRCLPLLTFPQDQVLRPDFIRNIFHPPD